MPTNQERSVRLTYAKAGTRAPVYVAGSFTSPPWEPVELDSRPLPAADAATSATEEREFFRDFHVPEGRWLFKFRLGPGDWWVCNDELEREVDDAGTWNNVLVVEGGPTGLRAGAEWLEVTPAPEKTDGPKAGSALDGEEAVDASGDGSGAPPEAPNPGATPLFAHEALTPADEEEPEDPRPESAATEPAVDATIEVSDHPVAEMFPSERGQILERIQTMKQAVGEDATLPDEPVSAVAEMFPTEREHILERIQTMKMQVDEDSRSPDDILNSTSLTQSRSHNGSNASSYQTSPELDSVKEETSVENAVDEPKEMALEEKTGDLPVETPKEEILEVEASEPIVEDPKEAHVEEPKEELVEDPKEAPVLEPKEELVEDPKEEPVEIPKEDSVQPKASELLIEEPKEESINAEVSEPPVDEPKEESLEETLIEEPKEESVEAKVSEPPIDDPKEEPVEEKASEPTIEEPKEELVEEKASEPPVDDPKEELVEEPVIEEPKEESVEAKISEPTVDDPKQEPVKETVIEDPKEESAEDKATEPPIDDPKEEPVEENEDPKEESVEDKATEPPVDDLKEEPVEEPVIEDPKEEESVEAKVSEPTADNPKEELVEEPAIEDPKEESIEDKASEPVVENLPEEPVEANNSELPVDIPKDNEDLHPADDAPVQKAEAVAVDEKAREFAAAVRRQAAEQYAAVQKRKPLVLEEQVEICFIEDHDKGDLYSADDVVPPVKKAEEQAVEQEADATAVKSLEEEPGLEKDELPAVDKSSVDIDKELLEMQDVDENEELLAAMKRNPRIKSDIEAYMDNLKNELCGDDTSSDFTVPTPQEVRGPLYLNGNVTSSVHSLVSRISMREEHRHRRRRAFKAFWKFIIFGWLGAMLHAIARKTGMSRRS